MYENFLDTRFAGRPKHCDDTTVCFSAAQWRLRRWISKRTVRLRSRGRSKIFSLTHWCPIVRQPEPRRPNLDDQRTAVIPAAVQQSGLAAFAPWRRRSPPGRASRSARLVAMRRVFGKSGDVLRRADVRIVTDNTLYFRVDDHNRAAVKTPSPFRHSATRRGLCHGPLLLTRAGVGCLTNPMRLSRERELRRRRRSGFAAKKERTTAVQ
jgi:hypothetical protein